MTRYYEEIKATRRSRMSTRKACKQTGNIVPALMVHTCAVRVLKSTEDSFGMAIGQLVKSEVDGVPAVNLGIHGEPDSTRFVAGHSDMDGETAALYGQFGSNADGAVSPGAAAVCT